jgi:UDP-N-acetyl-D-glucosamine dehydrogenase
MILNELKKKAQEGTLRVGVVGLGYVGLPLAVQFAVKGISVTGIDITKGKSISSIAAKTTSLMSTTKNLPMP